MKLDFQIQIVNHPIENWGTRRVNHPMKIGEQRVNHPMKFGEWRVNHQMKIGFTEGKSSNENGLRRVNHPMKMGYGG